MTEYNQNKPYNQNKQNSNNRQNSYENQETQEEKYIKANIFKFKYDSGVYGEFIENVKRYVQYNKGKITTSQIRNIFDKIKKTSSSIDVKEYDKTDKIIEIYSLRPKFAYIGGRQQNIKGFTDLLDECVKEIKTNKDVISFYEFVEAVVCYLKYYGDKN